MTDRVNGFLVILDRNIRVDDAEFIINAIKMIRGVIGVTPQIEQADYTLAKEQIKRELVNKLYSILE